MSSFSLTYVTTMVNGVSSVECQKKPTTVLSVLDSVGQIEGRQVSQIFPPNGGDLLGLLEHGWSMASLLSVDLDFGFWTARWVAVGR